MKYSSHSHSRSLVNLFLECSITNFLCNIEFTFNLLEFCVSADLRIRQIIRPKMDCFVCLHLLTFPTFFALGHVLMVGVSHVLKIGFFEPRTSFFLRLELESPLITLFLQLLLPLAVSSGHRRAFSCRLT